MLLLKTARKRTGAGGTPAPGANRNSSRPDLITANNLAVPHILQSRTGYAADVLAEKVDRTIGKYDLTPAGVQTAGRRPLRQSADLVSAAVSPTRISLAEFVDLLPFGGKIDPDLDMPRVSPRRRDTVPHVANCFSHHRGIARAVLDVFNLAARVRRKQRTCRGIKILQ